jgi:hypothetical protein
MSTSYETPREAPQPDPSPWHPLSTGHLVMGIAFVGLATVWMLREVGAVDIPPHGWLLGLPWVVAGATGLLATVVRHRVRPSGRMRGWIGHQDPKDSPHSQA